MPQPVAVVRLLVQHGLSLRKAHQAIDRLAAGDSFAVEVYAADLADLVGSLRTLGVQAAAVERPEVDPKEVRDAFGLSQRDFARRFGLEVRTIQNWEQNRNRLDAPTRILLALIRDNPAIVDGVLTSAPFQTPDTPSGAKA